MRNSKNQLFSLYSVGTFWSGTLLKIKFGKIFSFCLLQSIRGLALLFCKKIFDKKVSRIAKAECFVGR